MRKNVSKIYYTEYQFLLYLLSIKLALKRCIVSKYCSHVYISWFKFYIMYNYRFAFCSIHDPLKHQKGITCKNSSRCATFNYSCKKTLRYLTGLLMCLGLKGLICITMAFSERNNKIDLEITTNTISNVNRSMRIGTNP